MLSKSILFLAGSESDGADYNWSFRLVNRTQFFFFTQKVSSLNFKNKISLETLIHQTVWVSVQLGSRVVPDCDISPFLPGVPNC